MGQHGSAEEYFADMDAQAMNDEAMAAQSAEGEAAAAEAAQQNEGGHMDKLKRQTRREIAADVILAPSYCDNAEFCLSSDVEKLEANFKGNVDFLNALITVRDERISILEARVGELEQANTIPDSACVKALNERDQLKAKVKELEAEIVERRKDYSESVNKLDAENAILKADLAAVGEGWRVLGDCSPHPQREGGMK
jgi:hypothetical protein